MPHHTAGSPMRCYKMLLPAAQGPICKKPTFDIYQLDSIAFSGSFQLPKGLRGVILIKWAIVS